MTIKEYKILWRTDISLLPRFFQKFSAADVLKCFFMGEHFNFKMSKGWYSCYMIRLWHIFPADVLTIPTGNCAGGWFCTGQSIQAMSLPYSNTTDVSKLFMSCHKLHARKMLARYLLSFSTKYPIACQSVENVAQVSLPAIYLIIMLFYSCLLSKTSDKTKTST